MSSLSAAPTPGVHLVVGAGEVGSAVARLLADAGAPVVIVTRSGSGPEHPMIRRIPADASSIDALLAAAPTAAVIYNCANPPYDRWAAEWPPMAAAFIAYAEHTGAVLATVSNLYGYGPVDVPMTEDLPLSATGSKGRIRARMWLDARTAHDAGRIRATEVRGSDYICPGAQSRLGDRVVPKLLAGKGVQLLGPVDQPHSWTAPVDVARTLIAVGSDDRAWGRPWHVPSNPARTQRQAVDDLAEAAGVPPVKVGQLPNALVWALGVVNPTIRELREMAYQMERPYLLDDSATRTAFGIAPTPWSEVISGVLARYQPQMSSPRIAASDPPSM